MSGIWSLEFNVQPCKRTLIYNKGSVMEKREGLGQGKK